MDQKGPTLPAEFRLPATHGSVGTVGGSRCKTRPRQ